MECPIELALERVVNLVDLLPGFFELQAASQDLDAKVIFLIDHDGDRLVFADRHPARSLGRSVRLADQMAFDEQISIDFRSGLEIDIEDAGSDMRRKNRLPDARFQLLSLRTGASGQERTAGDIARQADA